MVESMFLRFIARLMMPVLLLFSVFMLLRGHDQPGGGFVGGLVAAGGIILLTLAYGPAEVRQRLPADFSRAMLYGVLVSAVSGTMAFVLQHPFMQSIWLKTMIENVGELKLGTPQLFDVGVYIVVLGATVSIVLGMAEEGE